MTPVICRHSNSCKAPEKIISKVKAETNTMIFTCGEGRYAVRLEVIEHDEGLTAIITGGEKSHAGAVALAWPAAVTESVKDGDLKHESVEAGFMQTEASDKGVSCIVRTCVIPGHRDDVVAGQVAGILFEAAGCSVAVTAGIHIDSAAKEEIDILINNCREVAEQAAEWYKRYRQSF